MRVLLCRLLVLFLVIGSALTSSADSTTPSNAADQTPHRTTVTNVARLRSLSSLEMNRGCALSLSGIVTLVDTNRNLLVLQDSSGVMAIYPDKPVSIQAGDLVSFQSPSATPFVVNFPDFPYRRSGSDIQTKFEAPSNWGDYHLNRLGGYLHPPITGEYTFWIASDNSSELWLSSDESPANVKRISYLKSGSWVNQYEWSRYPSQRSEPIFLRAGHAYYIEAFHEQLTQDDHMAAAWQGPDLDRSIIDGRYLTPWTDDHDPAQATSAGILREYWTNFSLGNLAAITGQKPVEFAVAARDISFSLLNSNVWPEPRRIDLAQPLAQDDNYRWVVAEGSLEFLGTDGHTATLELNAGQERTLIKVNGWNEDFPQRATNCQVRVEGVCEGAYTSNGQLFPGVIWTDAERLSFFQLPRTNDDSLSSYSSAVNSNGVLGGFFIARGVVTFNDRVLGKDCLFVQDVSAGIYVSQQDRLLRPALRVGQSVDLGGSLLPGKHAPKIQPLIVNLLGTHTLPEPAVPLSNAEQSGYRDAQWTELEGVVQTMKADGTLLLRRNWDSILVWVGHSTTNELAGCVDAAARFRGVISLETHDLPMLLVPSRGFTEIIEPSPSTPQRCSIAALKAITERSGWQHRVTIAGTVTYHDEESFFVQDSSGGARILSSDPLPVKVGDSVEVTGYPENHSTVPVLSECVVQITGAAASVNLRKTSLRESVGDFPNQMLVQIEARLLTQKRSDRREILELQAGQRLFEAVLPAGDTRLPTLASGSLLALRGVCVIEPVSPLTLGKTVWENATAGSVRLLLRQPSDVVVLRGPPWWNWKRAALLITLLFALLLVVILRSYFVSRQFERQQAARLAFARQLLQNQENERRRIAANLHDSLGQNLLAIKNQAHLALQTDASNPALHRRLEDISGTALQALEEVRQITHDLRPYQLDRLGLTQSLRALIRRVSEDCPIVFASHVDEIDGIFESESEINIYRIVQESLNNVLKHSQATEAAVVLRRENGMLTISIRDNGLGLSGSRGATETPAGFGLDGIRERISIMGGKMEMETSTGHGFILKVEIPLPTQLPCPPK